jgi:hypothetical protein
MNPWLSFVKSFYADERQRDPTKCRNSGTLKRVAKIYKCKKDLANRVTRKVNRFRGKNPMMKRSSRRSKP